MDRLVATLAFSRRTARRLNLDTIASDLSRVLHAVSQIQKSDQPENPIDQSQAGDTHKVMLDRKGADKSGRKRGRKLLDLKGDENNATCHTGGAMCDTLPEPTSTSIDSNAPSGTPIASSEMPRSSELAFTPENDEYDIQSLRHVLRDQLQNADRHQRLEALSGLSQLSLREVCQSDGLRMEIRIFRARYHLACLEEILALSS
eukprot:Skav213316  [mRNA]  locus=scaffold1383:192368:192976:+ [translate_table: standard]